MTEDLFQALAPVIKALEKLDVVHYVGGSVASSAFGLPRTTLDVDLVAELNAIHVKALATSLSQSFYVSEPMIRNAIRHRSCFNLIHLATMYKVDIFVAKDRPFDRATLSRITREDIGGPGEPMLVWLASAEDVVLNKLEWFRMGNEVSDRQWQDILGVLKVQGNQLDWAYLRKWAVKLGVIDLLERAFNEEG